MSCLFRSFTFSGSCLFYATFVRNTQIIMGALLSRSWPQLWTLCAVAVKHLVITKTLRNSSFLPNPRLSHCKSRNAGLGFLVFLSIHHWASITETQTCSSPAEGGLPVEEQEAKAQWRAAEREEGGFWLGKLLDREGNGQREKKDM